MCECYLELYGHHFAAVSATVQGVGGEEQLIGRDTEVRHPLLATDHPDDHIRHAVLGLK